MLSRRLLRVKAMQALYATQAQGETDYNKALKELTRSINQSRELYFFLFRLAIDLKILSNNKVLEQIEPHIQSENNYGEDEPLLKIIAQEIQKNKLYSEYRKEEKSYENDKAFLIKFFGKILPNIDEVYEIIENQSIYHNDEAEFIFSMIVKTIKSFKEDEMPEFLPLYDDPDDEKFINKLFIRAFDLRQETMDYIEKHANNWDADRVATLDTTIIQLITAEVKEFDEIDIKVTLNEWLEIAKFYSTERSYIFINGVLNNIIN